MTSEAGDISQSSSITPADPGVQADNLTPKNAASEIRGAKLGNMPYAEVARVFDGFVAPEELGEPRGGYNLPGKSTLERPYSTTTPETTRQTSYSPEQRPYVDTVIAYLNSLTIGKAFVATEKELPDLAQRIETKFKEQSGQRNYEVAVYDAILSMFNDFEELYPNLAPALDAVFRGGGANGSDRAVTRCINHLFDALRGRLTEDNLTEFKKELEEYRNFVQDHPDRQGVPVDYQVACAAPQLARSMIGHSKIAALSLAKQPEGQGIYDETIHEFSLHTSTEGEAGINNFIASLVRKSADAHQRGEI